jgi:broad specificity phosphatase PhoE
MMTPDQLSYVAKVEEECRAAFETEFLKIRAAMTYDQWRLAFKIGWRRGREDATRDWADHMARMAHAVADTRRREKEQTMGGVL